MFCFLRRASAEAIKSVTLLSFRRASDHSILVSSGPPPSLCAQRGRPEVHNVYDRKKQRFHREVGSRVSRVITSSSLFGSGSAVRWRNHQAFETPADPIVKSQMYTPEAGDWVIGDSISGGWVLGGDCVSWELKKQRWDDMQMMIPPYIILVEFKKTFVKKNKNNLTW